MERCDALLEDTAIIIDAYNDKASSDAKRLVSCNMVIRAIGNCDESIPIGATPVSYTHLAPIYTQGIFERWIKVGRIKKMSTVTTSGSRLEQLKNLSKVLAKQIDDCNNDMIIGPKYLPQLSKQYRETIKEIEEIEGVDREDDEIGEILSARKADGKPDAVR